MKKLSIFAIGIVLLALAACGYDTDSADWAGEPTAVHRDSATTVPPPPTPTGAARTDNIAPQESTTDTVFTTSTSAMQRMIIREADISFGTYDFLDTVDNILQITADHGGFVEASRQWIAGELWHARFTLRVPVGLFDQVNRELIATAEVLSFSTTSQDVTMEFNDLASRLRIREEEKRRVENMLEIATALPEILRLEQQLTNLRLTIEAYYRRMTEIDDLASFSIINVALRKLEPYEEEDLYYLPYDDSDGFGTQLASAFSTSFGSTINVLTNIALALAWAGPPLLLFGIVTLMVYIVIKKLSFIKRA